MNNTYASLSAIIVLAVGPAQAAPKNGTVVGGSATISSTSNTTTIEQTSQNATLDWQSFNIGTGESVIFVQPNSSSVALNRVLGPDPSSILGKLSANGKVFLINPNGILFGTGAEVNVGGLVASTRNITDGDFMSGNYRFNGTGDGSVVNQGTLNAQGGGYIALLGASVSNQGVITAKLGTVALASGEALTLDVAGDGLLNVAVNAGAVHSLVQNGGLIQADGGEVLLTARAAGNLLTSAVNNSGVIQAQTIESHDGVIRLVGDMQNGTVNVAGTLDASAPSGGNGGSIETSAAHVVISPTATVTSAAPGGTTGHWLIDPVDFTIAATGGDITGTALSTLLGSNSVTIQSVTGTNSSTNLYGSTSGSGNINVNDLVSWSANTLTLIAQNNININTTMNGSGTASLALLYGQGAVAAGNTSSINVNAPVNLPSGNHLSMTQGSDGVTANYSVINDMTALQAMNSNLSGNYALGSNLDASGVANFSPIGPKTDYSDYSHQFTGNFDGMGHTISNLTIDDPSTNYIGFFASNLGSTTIKNVGLVNETVVGDQEVGGLVGFNFGTISNSYVTGHVSGYSDVGGLIGYNGAGTVLGSYSSATVASSTTGFQTDAGGLVGYNDVATVNNSYATGAVNGRFAGGLIGTNNSSTVTNSYSTGPVTGGIYNNDLGGLIGYEIQTNIVTNSYWDITTSGQAYSAGGTGLTTAQLAAGLPAGFSPTVWSNSGNQTTPYLLSNPGPVLLATDTNAVYYNPIQSLSQLQGMTSNLAGNYALLNNVDATATSGWNSSAGFVPVGNSTTAFTGNFNGLGHTIANLYISTNSSNAGLFGVIGSAGSVSDLVLTGANVSSGSGNSNTGTLAGHNQGTITDVYSTGLTVSGARNAGGLVGFNEGSISQSATGTGTVNNTLFFAGGLVGYQDNGSVTNSYSGVNIYGGYLEVGGLVGGMDGTSLVQNSYSTGQISTGSSSGGVVGYLGGGTIVSSFWNTSVNGGLNATTGGVGAGSATGTTGLTTAGMQTQASFTPQGSAAGQWDFNNTWIIYANETAPLLRAFMTPLTVTANNVAATYDGSAYAGTSGVVYSVTPNMSNLSGTLTYAGGGTNVGTSTITPSGLYSNQLGYVITYVTGTLTINPFVVSLTGSRAYDGTDVFTTGALTFNALPDSQTLTLTGSGTVASNNAGAAQTLTLGTLALGNGSGLASNYTFVGGTQTATITPKTLTATVTAPSKVYDGTTTASATLSGLIGLVGTETLGVSDTASFNSKNVATADVVTVGSVTLSNGTNGGLASNYSLATGETAAADITPKALTATVTAPNKVYDGTTTASATLSGLTGLVGTETLGISDTASFNSKNVATADLVTVGSVTLSNGTNGGLASNYTLAAGETTAASILAKPLTVVGEVASNKVFDATTTASLTGGSLVGVVAGDALALRDAGNFANANPGVGKTVTAADTLSGAAASNYTVVQPVGLTADITAVSYQAAVGQAAQAAASAQVIDSIGSASSPAPLTASFSSVESNSIDSVSSAITGLNLSVVGLGVDSAQEGLSGDATGKQ